MSKNQPHLGAESAPIPGKLGSLPEISGRGSGKSENWPVVEVRDQEWREVGQRFLVSRDCAKLVLAFASLCLLGFVVRDAMKATEPFLGEGSCDGENKDDC